MHLNWILFVLAAALQLVEPFDAVAAAVVGAGYNDVHDDVQEATEIGEAAAAVASLHENEPSPASSCGGILVGRHGIIQTPNFPAQFATPLTCTWIIDASSQIEDGMGAGNTSIIVYLTQLYVLSGLTFTGYLVYDPTINLQIKSEFDSFELKEEDVTQVAWLKFSTKFLEIKFSMSTVYGTHLRAPNRLLDVFGFNITYEVGTVKPYQCNALKCRFLGHCFANANFRYVCVEWV